MAVKHLFLPIILALNLLIAATVAAGPSLKAVATDSAPAIDGDFSDACWQSVPPVTDFYHIASGTPAAEATSAWICYDQKNIYVAFDCKDSQPQSIHAQQKKRGGSMAKDDYVAFRIEPFGENRWPGHFTVNAAGTQAHEIESLQTGKTEWIGDWDAAVKRNPDGYSVEMRIPFSIFSYDHRNPRISLGFMRSHSRLSQQWWAPDIGSSYDYAKLYLWDGVRPPAIRSRPVMLLYSLAGAGSGDTPKRLGMDVKHSLTPSLTALLTANPDFQNVEQQVDSVDFTYTERRLPDSREFFSDGSKYLPGDKVYYSRRIGEIDAGLKLIGKTGDYEVGFMNARRFGHESYTLGQVHRRFGPNGDLAVWQAGVLSEVEGTDNLASYTNIRYKWRRNRDRYWDLRYTLLNSDSASGDGHGDWVEYEAWTVNGVRRLNFELIYRRVDSDFDPYLALPREKGMRRLDLSTYLWDLPKTGRVSEWQVGINSDFADHLDGSRYYNSAKPYVYIEWRNGRAANLTYSDSDRPPNHDRVWDLYYGWGRKDLYRMGGLSISAGKLVGGDYLYTSLSQGVRLSDRLSAHVWMEYSKIDEPSTAAGTHRQTVLSASYDFSPESGIVGRLIRSSGNSNVYLAYRRKVRVGLDAYLIYGDPNAEETKDTVLLKLIRPL